MEAKHWWGVTFTHYLTDTVKHYNVQAVGFSQAVTFATDALARDRLAGPDWSTTRIERGTVVEQAS